ncbi:MAG TPA: hypothetical protein VMG38_04305 [Trebonia sp.]|nr:hypothetical protein [Trebonia sp.]
MQRRDNQRDPEHITVTVVLTGPESRRVLAGRVALGFGPGQPG